MYNDEYQIVMEDNYLVLERKINQMIKDGWVPQGGLVAVSGAYAVANFFQAMTRNKELILAKAFLEAEETKI